MEATLTAVQIVILTTLIAIVALCVLAWWKRPSERLRTIPPLSWALSGVALYVAALVRDLPPRVFAFWAGALWLSTCFLVLGGVWLFLWPARKRR